MDTNLVPKTIRSIETRFTKKRPELGAGDNECGKLESRKLSNEFGSGCLLDLAPAPQTSGTEGEETQTGGGGCGLGNR